MVDCPVLDSLLEADVEYYRSCAWRLTERADAADKHQTYIALGNASMKAEHNTDASLHTIFSKAR